LVWNTDHILKGNIIIRSAVKNITYFGFEGFIGAKKSSPAFSHVNVELKNQHLTDLLHHQG
jgi:hypothetical protein